MPYLSCKIQIGRFGLKYVDELEIESSWKKKTDVCTLKLPRKLHFKRESIKDLLKRGDVVKIELGYNDQFVTEFQGYLCEIGCDDPMTLRCEDEMFKFKTGEYTKAGAMTLESVISLFYKGKTRMGKSNLGQMRFVKQTPAKILEMLRENYGLYSFFRKQVLTIGLQYDKEKSKTHVFDFNKNIISNDLEFRHKDDVKVKIKAVNIELDNSRIECTVGDKDGEEHSLHYFGLKAQCGNNATKAKEEMKKRAEADLKRMKFTGYHGKFTTFGKPSVQHGDIVVLRDRNFKEREGKYFVDEVHKTFGKGGFRQHVTLGAMVS
jgi:hypothetical protein